MTRPSGRRPRRGHTSRQERRVIRVLTEGKITEPSYLTAWARRYRHSVSLSLPESGMAPETLVDHATRLPYTTHAKAASKLRSPIRALSFGLCCTSKIRPRTSIGVTCSGAPTSSNLYPGRPFPTARGIRCSTSSKPPAIVPKRWISGTRATDRHPGGTQALTSGGSSTGSVPLAIATPTEVRSPERSPLTLTKCVHCQAGRGHDNRMNEDRGKA